MMASDSEESDYEDAGNHHDNNAQDLWHPANDYLPAVNPNDANANANGENGNNQENNVGPNIDDQDDDEELEFGGVPPGNLVLLNNNINVLMVDSDEDDGDVVSNHSYQSLDTERLSGSEFLNHHNT